MIKRWVKRQVAGPRVSGGGGGRVREEGIGGLGQEARGGTLTVTLVSGLHDSSSPQPAPETEVTQGPIPGEAGLSAGGFQASIQPLLAASPGQLPACRSSAVSLCALALLANVILAVFSLSNHKEAIINFYIPSLLTLILIL